MKVGVATGAHFFAATDGLFCTGGALLFILGGTIGFNFLGGVAGGLLRDGSGGGAMRDCGFLLSINMGSGTPAACGSILMVRLSAIKMSAAL